jgi:class 3 adenylate cyclase
MTFDEILEQAIDMLQRRGRVSYGALKRQFDLDNEYLADLKSELIEVLEVAADKDGKMLVWNGDGRPAAPSITTPPTSPPPASYTPPHLAERIRAEQAALEARGATDGERKTITALFADLKGSTALIEGLDPEEARAIIDPALQLMMDAVHRYEGYVAQALGDGIFALFGAPIAHEDHPQRALYAALRMQEEMRRYSDHVRLKHGAPLYMRIGVNTGEVVVRSIRKDDLHTDYVPVGHSTNLAARMEQMATPGSILITEYTRKLVEGYFELKALGAAEIKGVEEPLTVYEVLGAGPLRTKLQVAMRRGLTHFVGRQSEMDQLQRALAHAKAGHGQIVGVLGEPGLGKSRLFHEFKLTSQSGCLVLEAFSVSYGKASPYLPLIELLKSYFQIQPQDEERTRKEKVVGKVLILDRSLEDILPYLFSLLGIEDPGLSLQQMDAQIRRHRTLEALKKLFLRESLNRPLMLIFEDLHWIDTETQRFLDTLSESVASAKLLLLVNYRPEYRHEWGQKTYYTQLRLAPLGKAEAEELLAFLLGKDTALKPLNQLILEKTEGTPFFLEEVVQTLVEEGVLRGERGNYRLEMTPTELHIPLTVQGVLAARIDRLATDEKDLLQQLAVIGRVFPLSLVKHVVMRPEAELYRLLSALQSKEFLYEQPALPEVEYLFKHALTQEVAYSTVLQDRRKELHERTGRAIEELYADDLETHYSELAHHYQLSGTAGKAVEYLHLAGQQAMQRASYAEAVRHETAALALLEGLPDTPARRQQELTLQLALGVVLRTVNGFAAPEVERAYSRARDLCRQGEATLQLAPVLQGLWHFHLLRAELQTARELGEQLLSFAQRIQAPDLFPEAHRAVGEALLWLGELPTARAHLEQGIACYEPPQDRSHLLLYGGRRRRDVPHLCGPGLMVAGLSRPSTAADARGPDARSRAGASPQYGYRSHPFAHGLDTPPGGAAGPRGGRGGNSALHGARARRVLGGAYKRLAGLGTD